MNNTLKKRWFYLGIGTFAMLFAGIIYAWSILKDPFTEGFGWMTDAAGPGWSAEALALNFTITMSFFCLGGLLGARLAQKTGHRFAILLAGVLSATGFVLTSLLQSQHLLGLYLAYGVLAGTGIGIAYNVIISTVSAWFPDKKGLCSGFLMMGFGASALVLGSWAALRLGCFEWRSTYVTLGLALGVVLILTGLVLKKPGKDVELPAVSKQTVSAGADMTPRQMLRRPSFYLAFLYLVFLTAVGSSVISFARDLASSTGASGALATTLVGVLSVCNGLGRILTGALFDRLGCRKTMFLAAGVTVAAAGVILISVLAGNLWLCVIGLCLTGISYGASPTTASAFTANFYGTRYFSTNMAIMVFNMMVSSFVATLSSSLLAATGSFVVPFAVLLVFSLAALILNLFIKKP